MRAQFLSKMKAMLCVNCSNSVKKNRYGNCCYYVLTQIAQKKSIDSIKQEKKLSYKLYCKLVFNVSLFFPLTGCGSVINNTLTSPEYPNSYPNDMDCVYKVPILQGMALKIYFDDFLLQAKVLYQW